VGFLALTVRPVFFSVSSFFSVSFWCNRLPPQEITPIKGPSPKHFFFFGETSLPRDYFFLDCIFVFFVLGHFALFFFIRENIIWIFFTSAFRLFFFVQFLFLIGFLVSLSFFAVRGAFPFVSARAPGTFSFSTSFTSAFFFLCFNPPSCGPLQKEFGPFFLFFADANFFLEPAFVWFFIPFSFPPDATAVIRFLRTYIPPFSGSSFWQLGLVIFFPPGFTWTLSLFFRAPVPLFF